MTKSEDRWMFCLQEVEGNCQNNDLDSFGFYLLFLLTAWNLFALTPGFTAIWLQQTIPKMEVLSKIEWHW